MSNGLITSRSQKQPVLRPVALANGTLPSLDLSASRRFYEEVLALEVVSKGAEGLVIRLGGDHTYLVEPVSTQPAPMVLLNHNGFYLETNQPVEEAYSNLLAVKDKYSIRAITKPNWQHGYHAFFLQDCDGNWWEFHHPPTKTRTDLSDTRQLSADEARSWFMARRQGVSPSAEPPANSRPRAAKIVANAKLSHATLESADLQTTRRFYEEVLGLCIRQFTPVSIHIDLGDYLYAVVHAPNASKHMPSCYRNTLLFGSSAAVEQARAAIDAVASEYQVMELSDMRRSSDRYFFHVRDLDGNLWELAYDIHGGYHQLFGSVEQQRAQR